MIVLLLTMYFSILVSAYLGLSFIKSWGLDSSKHVAAILAIVVAVLLLQSFLFRGIYHRIYVSNRNAFSGSDIYKERKREEAVKALWLSKDIKRECYFPNWLLLELSDYLVDTNNLDVFFKSNELYYGSRITYDELRNKLSKEYSELLVRVVPKPIPPNMPAQGSIIDLPGVSEFMVRLSSKMEAFGIRLNAQNKQDPVLNNLSISLITLLNSLSDDVPVSRLDVLLDVKSEEMVGLLGGAVDGEKREQIRTEVEKILYFYLARRMVVKTTDLPVELGRGDFLFYSALSFFSANTGDIQPVSVLARAITFTQVLGTFVILVLAIAFLGGAVEGVGGVSIGLLKKLMLPAGLLMGLVTAAVIIAAGLAKYAFHKINADILRVPENYGYSIQMDGTVNLMINVDNPARSSQLSKHYSLSMPYKAVFGENMRYPGVLITGESAMIVWAEILPPAIDSIHVYGDGYDIGEIREPYKLLIPASFTAFLNQ